MTLYRLGLLRVLLRGGISAYLARISCGISDRLYGSTLKKYPVSHKANSFARLWLAIAFVSAVTFEHAQDREGKLEGRWKDTTHCDVQIELFINSTLNVLAVVVVD